MAGETEHRAIEVLTLPPELAVAIVAAQRAAGKLIRDGDGDKGAYTTSDSIAAAAGKALNSAGAAWVRVGVDTEAPSMQAGDIGNQSYVGDLTQTWLIVHESGAALRGSSRMPVIVSRGRPQDKAVAASLTFDVGQALRGAVCQDRESKQDAIDRRKDDGPSNRGQQPRPAAPKPPDLGPRCTGPKGDPIAESNRRRCRALAEVDENADPGDVWEWALREAAIDLSKYAHTWPVAPELTISDGLVVRAILKTACGRNGVDDAEAEQAP